MKSKIFSNLFYLRKEKVLNNYQLIKELSSEASNRFLNKQYESAVALTDKIFLLDQNNFSALNIRAMSLENLGYYLDAIDDYNKAIELRPNDANLIGLCGVCYNSIGDFQKAREYLKISVNKGMKIYVTSLQTIDILSEATLKMMKEHRSTPERMKRRTGKEFTISNEAVNLKTIDDSLKEFYLNTKNALNADPENKHLKELVDHYKKYFEET